VERAVPKPTGVQRILSDYRRPVITDLDATCELIDLAGESNPDEMMAHLTSVLLESVRQEVAEAPTTDEGWGRVFFFVAGGFTPEDGPAARPERSRAAYHAGVEALRRYFNRAGAGGEGPS
jgi:hypothetical protein